MAKKVVQIPCNAFALRLLGQTFDLRICTFQKRIGACLLGKGEVTQPKNHAVKQDVFGCSKRKTEMPSLHHHSGHHHDQHQEQRAQSVEEKAKRRERIDKYNKRLLVERVINKDDKKEAYKS